ncbi:hypothetical protein PTH_1440 [Pelotomaculum thermopropionicum SI]|uniref:Geranylgeranyl pyrophosphate synthase n=1 Tax=Pelotomaculum thermopropionicum (strain DSM 13744 / JCM 10971 / SI) TaxID=370438 RepID=A5D2A6_PELTS|nr:hypothetical protein PTH_1440 [Pelotomaculum thermopropionicum SI]
MLADILEPIEAELRYVSDLIEGHLTIKAGYLGDFAHLEFSYTDKTVRPALVILSSRIYGLARQKTALLASVFQFIHMASKVHQGISENDSNLARVRKDPRNASQFPVLVGDYLYGKFFTLLCDAGMTGLLQPLAEIICQIHEGSILKKKLDGKSQNSHEFYEAVRKETAELFAGCCTLGARMAGAPDKDQDLLKQFGRSLGMVYGLLEQGIPVKYAAAYLEKALSSLALLPDTPERKLMEKMTDLLSGRLPRRMVI